MGPRPFGSSFPASGGGLSACSVRTSRACECVRRLLALGALWFHGRFQSGRCQFLAGEHVIDDSGSADRELPSPHPILHCQLRPWVINSPFLHCCGQGEVVVQDRAATGSRCCRRRSPGIVCEGLSTDVIDGVQDIIQVVLASLSKGMSAGMWKAVRRGARQWPNETLLCPEIVDKVTRKALPGVACNGVSDGRESSQLSLWVVSCVGWRRRNRRDRCGCRPSWRLLG